MNGNEEVGLLNNVSGYLIFVNTDKNGEIIDALTGFNIVPNRNYKYFFYRERPINIEMYKVENGRLIEK